jgi:hypothetical protein
MAKNARPAETPPASRVFDTGGKTRRIDMRIKAGIKVGCLTSGGVCRPGGINHNQTLRGRC